MAKVTARVTGTVMAKVTVTIMVVVMGAGTNLNTPNVSGVSGYGRRRIKSMEVKVVEKITLTKAVTRIKEKARVKEKAIRIKAKVFSSFIYRLLYLHR